MIWKINLKNYNCILTIAKKWLSAHQKVLGLCDEGLYYIARYLGENLAVLELDFLPNLSDPGTTLFNLSQNCPNIKQLSLCRFFEVPFSEKEKVKAITISFTIMPS